MWLIYLNPVHNRIFGVLILPFEFCLNLTLLGRAQAVLKKQASSSRKSLKNVEAGFHL